MYKTFIKIALIGLLVFNCNNISAEGNLFTRVSNGSNNSNEIVEKMIELKMM